MKTSWAVDRGGEHCSIRLTFSEVVVGSTYGTGMTDNAGACSYADFLAGRFHDTILDIFGRAVLEDVIAAVRAAVTYPPFVEQRAGLDGLRRYILSIPLDPTLEGLDRRAGVQDGGAAYGNAGGYKTVVRSDTVTLTVERGAGWVEPNDGGERRPFTVQYHCSAAVEHHDTFYLCVSDRYAVIGADGRVLDDGSSLPESIGSSLRLHRVYRWHDTIGFAYWWSANWGPPGLLRYGPGKGFTGRWEQAG